ncbi:MAG: formimidoylglutamase [Cytophagales bacterium]|nr:formimidoylglutamase [Cytophagales bacterium]
MDRYQLTDSSIWTGRIDSQTDISQYRVHQIVKPIHIHQLPNYGPGFSLLGYACDEGVRRNKGKVGAVDGPQAFRKALANLAAHDIAAIHDLGDITCHDANLGSTQAQFSEIVAKALLAKQQLVVIGGGHDIAYGHFNGIRKALGNEAKIGIINFDAHFDLREVKEHPSSGTPFWQIAQEEDDFNYCCIGIQRSGNTKKLFDTAKENDVLVIERNSMADKDSQSLVQHFIASIDYLYLTVDLDGFDMSLCPGVSAPTVNGFTFQEIIPFLHLITESKKLISMDIAELNPHYDREQQTAKMAAYLTDEVMNKWS